MSPSLSLQWSRSFGNNALIGYPFNAGQLESTTVIRNARNASH
jgi:hypothetical protein